MVLQVGADAGQVMHDRHTDRLQMIRRSHTRDLQQMRGVDRSARQDDLAVGTSLHGLAALLERDANATLAVEQQFRGNGLGFNPQVWPAARFLQECLCRRASPTAFAGHLRVADTFLLPSVQVVAEIEAGLLGGGDETVCQWEDRSVVLHLERTVLAAILRVVALLIGFRFAEIRQHVIETPAPAAHLCPAVEIGRIAADVQHSVDGTRSAQGLAARPVDAPSAAAFGSLGAVIPVDYRVVQSFRVPAGMWIQSNKSFGPASRRTTFAPVSLSRAATTQPAEPAPTTM